MAAREKLTDVLPPDVCESDYRRQFFQISTEMLSAGRMDGVIKIANPAFLRGLGWTLEELQSRPWRELVHPDDRERVEAEIQAAVAEGRIASGENRVRHADGSYRWLSWRFPAPGPDGWIFCSARDVTEEQRWREERRLLAMVAERTDNGVIQLDPEGRVQWVNAGFERLTGYSFAEVRGRRPGEVLWGPETDGRAKETILEAIRARRAFDVEILKYRKDGRKYWVRIEARPLERYGEFAGFMTLELDITERKERESQARQHAALLNHAGRLAQMGGWELVIGADAPVWSEEVFRIHEVERDYQPTLEAALNHYPEEARGRLTAAITNSITTGEPWDLELPFITAKGNHRWVRALGEPEMVNGKCVRLTGTFQDITERYAQREALERLVEELRMERERALAAHRAKSDLLAVMSHEIRTPLNGVLGMLELLATSPLPPETHEFAKLARQSGQTLSALLNDILDLSKAEAGRLELEQVPFQAAAVVQEVRDLFISGASAKGLALTIHDGLDPEACYYGDPGRLRQILVNLVGNAIKFTASGGVSVWLDPWTSPSGADGLEIAVQDTGIGIPAETLPRLFEKFTQADSSTTRRFGGTGLGLAITRRLVQLMGGSIDVRSETGVGSTFVCRLPLTRTESPAPTSGFAPLCRLSVSGLRVLLVEDNPINQRVARGLLERQNCKVVVAGDGSKAVELVAREKFDIVLMDGQMPDMDGYAAARAIRQLNSPAREVPIVALTASALQGDRERCLEAGMDDYLTKPIQLEPLIDALERWGRASAGDRSGVRPKEEETVAMSYGG